MADKAGGSAALGTRAGEDSTEGEMTVMRGTFLSILLASLSFGNLACTYNSAVRGDFHPKSVGFGNKLPLKVALVADPTIKTYEFRASGHGFNQHIAVYPELINATVADLEELFDQVRVVDHPEQATAEEFLGFVRLTTKTQQEANVYVDDVYGYRLLLSIYDHGRNLVAQHEHSGRIHPSTPNTATVASVMVGPP